jgi:hypothetical protein
MRINIVDFVIVIVFMSFTLFGSPANAYTDLAKDQWSGQIKDSTYRPVFLDVRDCLVDLNGFDIDSDVLYDSFGRLMDTDAVVYDSAGYEVNRRCTDR